ncbi:MAG TPA: hypothetical protein VH333_08365 [Pseudonocardiaceae bacterium]|jgi:hypothetical protein|nr:hypothetical protein [Pseudonocardiaceae bacterium]
MMGSSAPAAQFDLGTVRSPVGNDERLASRLVAAALIGLAVGAAFLLVSPRVPGLVRSAWCVGVVGPGCDPGSQTTGQLIDVVIWSLVLAATATVVCAPLGWLADVVGRVRLSLPLVLLGPPLVWALVVLGEPLGIGLNDRMRSPWVLAQATVAYVLAGVLTGARIRPLWRWLIAVALVLGTAAVIVRGYPYD